MICPKYWSVMLGYLPRLIYLKGKSPYSAIFPLLCLSEQYPSTYLPHLPNCIEWSLICDQTLSVRWCTGIQKTQFWSLSSYWPLVEASTSMLYMLITQNDFKNHMFIVHNAILKLNIGLKRRPGFIEPWPPAYNNK